MEVFEAKALFHQMNKLKLFFFVYGQFTSKKNEHILSVSQTIFPNTLMIQRSQRPYAYGSVNMMDELSKR